MGWKKWLEQGLAITTCKRTCGIWIGIHVPWKMVNLLAECSSSKFPWKSLAQRRSSTSPRSFRLSLQVQLSGICPITHPESGNAKSLLLVCRNVVVTGARLPFMIRGASHKSIIQMADSEIQQQQQQNVSCILLVPLHLEQYMFKYFVLLKLLHLLIGWNSYIIMFMWLQNPPWLVQACNIDWSDTINLRGTMVSILPNHKRTSTWVQRIGFIYDSILAGSSTAPASNLLLLELLLRTVAF